MKKYSLILFILTSYFANANEYKDEFNKRQEKVLENRKSKLIDSVSVKLNINREITAKNLEFTQDGQTVQINGHLPGDYGVCHIFGKISLLETSVKGDCISKTHRVSIIWP